jgi:adenylosuccinate lyase
MTNIMKKIVDGLVVNEPMINRNLNMTRGLLFSGRILLALVEHGLSREDAYAIVQDNAMRCWESVQSGENGESLYDLLALDPRLSGLISSDRGAFEKLFDLDFYLRYVDDIFKRFSIFRDGNFSE